MLRVTDRKILENRNVSELHRESRRENYVGVKGMYCPNSGKYIQVQKNIALFVERYWISFLWE